MSRNALKYADISTAISKLIYCIYCLCFPNTIIVQYIQFSQLRPKSEFIIPVVCVKRIYSAIMSFINRLPILVDNIRKLNDHINATRAIISDITQQIRDNPDAATELLGDLPVEVAALIEQAKARIEETINAYS